MREPKEIKLTPKQARPKIEHYCAYQERCHKEVKNKLFEYGLHPDDVNEIISYLIQANFLNEERFAKAFAGGKFRTKQWGRNKIKQELKFRQVSEYCIKKGLAEIDEDRYLETLKQVAEKKLKLIKDKHPAIVQQKLTTYLMSRGYETDLIRDTLKELLND